MIQRLERNGVTAEYEVAYALGSGTHAFAYLIQLSDRLFQSPIGYFPGRGWEMSPLRKCTRCTSPRNRGIHPVRVR